MKIKVGIYYPSRVTGGAEFLLLNVANLLRKKYDVYIFDVENGWLSSNSLGIKKELIKKNQPIKLDRSFVLITTANLTRMLDGVFVGDFKLISWVVQPYNIVPVLPRVKSFQFKFLVKYVLSKTLLFPEYIFLKRHTDYLIEKNSIFVMDDACNDVFEEFFSKKIENYMPIFISENKFLKSEKVYRRNEKKINCLWVGRLDRSFKTPILKYLLIKISSLPENLKSNLVFNVVGNGDGLQDLKDLSKKISGLEINFLLELKGKDLLEVIDDSDIGFAMGTSALEIAARKIPTVLLDFSYGKIPSVYKFQWIFNSLGYSVGRSIKFALIKNNGNSKTIDEIFSDLLENNEIVSNMSYKHVFENHNPEVAEKIIVSAIENSNSVFDEMQKNGLVKKPYWEFLKRYL